MRDLAPTGCLSGQDGVEYSDMAGKPHQGLRDFAETAFDVCQKAIGESARTNRTGKRPRGRIARSQGRVDGWEGAGGQPERGAQVEIARQAAKTRWAR